MSDQTKEEHDGSFIGWTMTLWGSTIDASQAKTFLLADPDVPFPPPADPEDVPPVSPSPTVSKIHSKPTEHLPGDHGTAEGEADKPAFSSVQSDIVEPTSSSEAGTDETMTPTPDEGWFPGMYNLVSNSKWVFGAIGVVAFCGIAGGAFFLWRRSAARRAQYRAVAGDDVNMSAFGRDRGRGTGGTKELYDAFGEVSDDEDVDEETQLRQPLASQNELAFHSGFLDDHDDERAQPLYSDEPGQLEKQSGSTSKVRGNDERSKSPSSSGESWEHADPS